MIPYWQQTSSIAFFHSKSPVQCRKMTKPLLHGEITTWSMVTAHYSEGSNTQKIRYSEGSLIRKLNKVSLSETEIRFVSPKTQFHFWTYKPY